MNTALSIFAGIALAAAAGFRAFVPLLAAGLAIHFGLVDAAPAFAWLGEPVALAALTAATLIEVTGYFVPGVDHALDVIAAPVALVAGITVAASVMVGLPDWLRWLAAIVAGGAATTATYSLTSLGRLKSSAVSGGLANPIYAGGELAGSALLAALALLVPVIALIAVAALVLLLIRRRTVLKSRCASR